MEAKKAEGWAILNSHDETEIPKINVRSVSPTKRGAIVNFLVTDRGYYVTNDMTDAQIERAWVELRREAIVTRVIITEE